MDFRNSCLVPAALSLLLGLGVWYIIFRLLTPALGAGYGVLSLDAEYGDRMVGELLSRGGLGNYLSESTQWVFLDDFGELLRIPLDTYEDRVTPFDPRNDGYPERLRSFFVHGGKRFFFIPLPRGLIGASPGELEDRVARCLGDIPFRLDAPASSRPLGLYALLFAAAAAALVLLSGVTLGGISLLPLLGALCSGGAGGFTLAAVLTALFALLREPLGEFFVSRRYSPREAGRLRHEPALFRRNRLPVLVVTALYGGVCVLSGFPLAAGIAALLSFALILPLALRAGSNRGAVLGHIRFVPVPISGRSIQRGRPFRIAVPFALASLAALVLPPLLGFLPRSDSGAGLAWTGMEAFLVDSSAYEAHAAFQRSFSRRPLRYGEGPSEEGEYLRYHRGADGLIGGAQPGDTGGEGGLPPFPLEDLTAFLRSSGSGSPNSHTRKELIPVLTVLLFCVPALFPAPERRRNKRKYLIYNDKRIAA
ncbi:MAG: hypothetical protein LBU28_05495 [Spirochaetaceae bacterium]|jgi:hypothetical protein|nr:hypothetical protein [Spirochaetaceae bacterium]